MTDAIRDALEAVVRFTDHYHCKMPTLGADEALAALGYDAREALAALDAETPATPADVGEEPVAWRWKQIGRTDADAWSYQFGHPQMSDTLYVTEPVYSATALERVVRERDEARAERDENFAEAKRVSSEYHELGKENLTNHQKARAAEAKLAEARKVIERLRGVAQTYRRFRVPTDLPEDESQQWQQLEHQEFAARRFLEETK